MATSIERFPSAWSAGLTQAHLARDQNDLGALRLSFDTLLTLAFQSEDSKPLNQLAELKWTPWMQEPKQFFSLFQANIERAEQLFQMFPEYAGWFPLSAYALSGLASGAPRGGAKMASDLERLFKLACFEKTPFDPGENDALHFSTGLRGTRYVNAETIFELSIWSRATRPRTLSFYSNLMKSATRGVNPGAEHAYLAQSASKALLLAQGTVPASRETKKMAADLLSILAEGGRSAEIKALCSAETLFQRELTQKIPPQPIRHHSEMAGACLSLLQQSCVGRALLGPNPISAATLLALGADRPAASYWREELVHPPERLIQELGSGGKESAKAKRKIERAQRMLPLAIKLDEELRDKIKRALEGEKNEMSTGELILSIGHTPTLAEIALTALMAPRGSSSAPQANLAAIGPALSAILEPQERLHDAMSRALVLCRAGPNALARVPDELKAYLEGVEIQEATATPSAASRASGRFSL